ncbi:nitrous oxide-stimulated promoter family protein [Clostridium sp. MSJ-11]|uniref:Nitrous oxide-stimulated promoter family protein n=1 Tax=Clostridium mobile TaxID=2841512 RepID=A0ABS6EDD4_9CLOT|nr:nitrous oxide-stimulated promoter family protein [Clostridium mobile]MBU5483211.1 nitrous oxide-stimulated promoter family protein [Clostridium mobile]
MRKIEKEKKVVKLMITLYCEKKHKYKEKLCNECEELLDYTHKKLTYCKFGEEKNSCKRCSIHCYKEDMREKIRRVMRFSAPRIIIHKPQEFMRHMLK